MSLWLPASSSYFWDSVSVFAWAGLDHDTSICASPKQRWQVHHCTQLLVEMESHKLFVQSGF
jgi:hypothetical protein